MVGRPALASSACDKLRALQMCRKTLIFDFSLLYATLPLQLPSNRNTATMPPDPKDAPFPTKQLIIIGSCGSAP